MRVIRKREKEGRKKGRMGIRKGRKENVRQMYICVDMLIFLFYCIVGCPPGFFLDTSTKHCRECDIGSYQDTEGQVTCHPCPSGYTTKGKNSGSVYDCFRVKEGHRHMNRQSHRHRNRHTQVAPGDTQ